MARKNKRGRPPNEVPSHQIAVRLPENVIEYYQEEAGVLGLPLATWIRSLLVRRMKRLQAKAAEGEES